MQANTMRKAGLGLITLGFLGGCMACVLDHTTVNLAWFVPSFILGIIGVAVVQIAIKNEAKDETKREANFQILDQSMTRIVDAARTLDEERDSIDIYDVPDWIDERFRGDIQMFVEARESIAHSWGTQAYAEVMSHFAAAERYLNRVWSTAADGYIDESHAFMTRSREEFEEALEKLKASGPTGSVSASTSAAAPA
jgi:cell division protein FtsB